MIKYDPFTDNEPSVYAMSVTYVQPADTDSNKEEDQFLTITSIVSPGEDEPYYRISLPEGSFWSINEPEELVNIINDFKEKLNIQKK